MSHRKFEKSNPKVSISKLPHLGMTKKDFIDDFKRYYGHRLGRDANCRSLHYAYEALAMAISDRLIERWKDTYNSYRNTNCKRGFYLSMEFLMGRGLSNAMLNWALPMSFRKPCMI
jgi:glycogen phosphorylase